ncbi:anoctamin-7-like protein [Dinothrombium tinctorium]|uniref:Anoctamin n=1 Tax=Dinothrombium tinctorium TaxID=1965070 RepID=A0A3S3S7G2_9ACAR|nr:anoctamin-7-like protein [Dinothrombium tinctorium]
MEEEVLTAKSESSRKSVNERATSIHFIKLSVPWHLLIHYAEELSMRAPLQAHPNLDTNWSEKLFKSLKIPNFLYESVPNRPLTYYTCPFKKSKINRFLGHENQDEYFSDTQRIRIIYEILKNTVYGKRKKAQIGIDRLVDERVFAAAFPLHDGPYQSDKFCDTSKMNKRQILYTYWAKWSKWYKYQPLDHIREYFGEQIAMYFAWLGFYTAWLLPAAIVGVLVFLYGVCSVGSDLPSNEVCDKGEHFKMCPPCDEKDNCKYWNLDQICFFSKLSYLFDHPGTVFYSIFVSFWAVTFLEYWKRTSISLAHHWDCMDYEEEEEKPRPEFAARAPLIERNPVTGLKEPSFPEGTRFRRMVAGLGAILLMVSLVLIFLVGIIIYRVVVSIELFRGQRVKGWVSIIASSTGAMVNLILIMGLGRVYERLANRLTEWEMHRTQTEFNDQLTFKVFIFQFINFYSSIFYVAFFKGRFVGYPGRYNRMFSLRNEDCSNSGCLMELAQQLMVIMIGKQMINNAQEILWPKLKTWWHKKRTRFLNKEEKLTRWEEDYQLIQYEGLFQEYLEMILQFGFITIFVAAFPLAPLFALLNNWIEIRLDSKKLVCETRRPVAERAQNIGVWFSILTFLAHIAVISNVRIRC